MSNEKPKSDPAQVSPEEKKRDHIGGIKKTLLPGIVGTIIGALSFYLITGGGMDDAAGFLLLVVAIAALRYLFPLMGINPVDFERKDWFYVGFMTFNFWFVTWTLLLN